MDDDETPVDLTNAASIAFFMKKPGAATPKIDAANAAFLDKPNGSVRYVWQTGDTNEAGTFNAHFVVTWGGGEESTYPNAGFIQVKIRPEI
jgi:hypothetical protein